MSTLRTALLLLSTTALAQDPDEVSAKLKRARRPDACVATWLAAKKTFPTAYLRGVGVEASVCSRRVMNTELDRLLVPLKKTAPARFKLGMDAQRQFNEAVKQFCGRWEPWYQRCCSTCSFTEQTECEMDFHGARVAMVDDALASRPPAEIAVKHPRPRVAAAFTDFAAAWCEFLEAKPGDACAARVLAALEAGQRDTGEPLSCRRDD